MNPLVLDVSASVDLLLDTAAGRALLARLQARTHWSLCIVSAEHLGAPLVTTDERLAGSPGLSVATITADHG